MTKALPGANAVYVSGAGEDVTLFTRVEDVALQHYKDAGYPQGIW